MSVSQGKPAMIFKPTIVGDAIWFTRAWVYTRTVHDETTTITIWQDGAWWCMTHVTQCDDGFTRSTSTWGSASQVVQELRENPIGINHIDFTHLK